MPIFTNPFKKHDVSEFPGVLVPLQQAAHRNSVTSQHVRRASVSSSPSRDNKNEKDEKDATSDVDSAHHGVTYGTTVQSLKAEIEADLSSGGMNTAYDRTSLL
jgi:hypothetical protein